MSEIMTTVFTQSTNPAAIFKLIDKDDSKSLDIGEMTTALAEFGLSAEVLEGSLVNSPQPYMIGKARNTEVSCPKRVSNLLWPK